MENTRLTLRAPQVPVTARTAKVLILFGCLGLLALISIAWYCVSLGGASAISPLILGTAAALILPALFAFPLIRLSPSSTAYSAHFEDEALVLHTSLGTRRIAWNGIARVLQQKWSRQIYVTVLLYDGRHVVMCPPLPNPELVARELLLHATCRLDATDISEPERLERSRQFQRNRNRIWARLIGCTLAMILSILGGTIFAIEHIH